MSDIDVRDGFAHYECGCKFAVTSLSPLRLTFDVENPPLTCSRTWDLLGEGNTKGVFQLETRFGQQFAKKLKPVDIEQLAALTAIMRPGCLQAIRDGKNVAEHYIDRKNEVEPVEFFHPSLEPILGSTFGEMIYQEQAMQIAQVLAGFTLQQADVLRKAIGKKKADIMALVKIDFLAGCQKMGIVTDEEAEAIFGWIEKSQRYSFNKSHAVSYAINAYISAYCKAHFPVSFFTSYLWYSKDKGGKRFDEIKLLVSNARIMGIDVFPPDFRHANKHFKRMNKADNEVYNSHDDKVYFGFADIKGVGDSKVKKLDNAIYNIETALGRKRKTWDWIDFLVYFSQEIDKTVVEGMIEAGALGYLKVDRSQMLFEYEQYSKLTKKEMAWIKQNLDRDSGENLHEGPAINSVSDLLGDALKLHDKPVKGQKGPCHTPKRVTVVRDILHVIDNPPYSMVDSPDWIARIEEARLGISITATVLDACKNSDQANCTIMEFQKHHERNSGTFIACQIDQINTHICKDDREMAFIEVSDGEASMDCVVFANAWEGIKPKGICVVENTVMLSGDRSRDGESFVIKNLWQLT